MLNKIHKYHLVSTDGKYKKPKTMHWHLFLHSIILGWSYARYEVGALIARSDHPQRLRYRFAQLAFGFPAKRLLHVCKSLNEGLPVDLLAFRLAM